MSNEPMDNKSKEMKQVIDKLLPGTLDKIKKRQCPCCSKPISPFKDALSEREYRISGLCQNCQDEVFGS